MNKIELEEKGKKAFELIAYYPLYCSTSGITYQEGIKVAKAVFGKDWEKELEL